EERQRAEEMIRERERPLERIPEIRVEQMPWIARQRVGVPGEDPALVERVRALAAEVRGEVPDERRGLEDSESQEAGDEEDRSDRHRSPRRQSSGSSRIASRLRSWTAKSRKCAASSG